MISDEGIKKAGESLNRLRGLQEFWLNLEQYLIERDWAIYVDIVVMMSLTKERRVLKKS